MKHVANIVIDLLKEDPTSRIIVVATMDCWAREVRPHLMDVFLWNSKRRSELWLDRLKRDPSVAHVIPMGHVFSLRADFAVIDAWSDRPR